MRKVFAFIIVYIVMSCAAYAGDLTVGGVWGYKESPYKGVDGVNDMWGYKGPLPFAMYDSKYFFVGLPFVGVHVLKGPLGSVDVSLGLLANKLDPDESDDWAVGRMDERKYTFTAGVGGTLNTPWGSLKGSLRSDILGRSDSVEAMLTYVYHFFFMDKRLIVQPSATLTWTNGAHNDYYYGVTAAEATRSGLSAYDAGSALTPSLDVSVTYMINKNLGVSLSGGYTFLPSEVKSSPIVDKSTIWGAGISVIYKFGGSDNEQAAADIQNKEPSSMDKLRAQRAPK